jgi:hypothetical protein
MIQIPIPLNHKLVEFGIAFALVVLLAYFSGGSPPKHRKK